MPDLGKVANVLGTALLAGAGPSGRGVAGNLLNQQRAIAFKEKEMEADRLRQEQEDAAARANTTFEALRQLYPTVQNESDREKVGALLVNAAQRVGFSPEDAQGLLFTPPDSADPYSAQAKLTADFKAGRISEADYRAGMRKLNYIRPTTPAVQIINGAPVESGSVDPSGMGIIDKAEEATGPMSSLKQAVSDYTGWLFEGQLFPETVEAKQAVKLFNKTAEEALVQNPRFPVAEQEFVRSMLVDPDVVFQDPDDAKSRMLGLKGYLEARIAADDKSIMNNTVTEKRKAELINMNDKRRQVLSMMGDEKATAEVEVSAEARTVELAQKVADGSATDEELDEFMELQNGR